MEVAAAWCHDSITPTAETFITKRGLDRKAMEAIGLGFYASASSLREHLRERGFDSKAIEDSGVVFTRMEGYVVFPWRDERGRLITLYGRAVPGCVADDAPKMMGLPGQGSKRSPLFLDWVLSGGHRDLVLVEGLFDAAVLQSRGDARVACFAGAQLSADQAETVARQNFRRVYVCGDPDSGGDAGCVANAKRLRSLGVPAFIAPRLPDGIDPDTFVLDRGLGAWGEHLEGSMRAGKYLALDAARGVTPFSSDAEKEECIRRCLDIVTSATYEFAHLDTEAIVGVMSEATGYEPDAIALVEESITTKRRRETADIERRAAITTAARSITEGEDIGSVSGQLATRLASLAGSEVRVEPYSTDAMLRALANPPPGIPGGFGRLDEEASFRAGELSLLAARPGHGKTSVLAHLLHRWAIVEGRRVVFVSLEEKREDIFCRLVARLCETRNPGAGVTTSIVRAHLSVDSDKLDAWFGDLENIDSAVEEMRESDSLLEIIYRPQLSPSQVEAELDRVMTNDDGVKAEAVLVDYVNRIRPDESKERRDIQVTAAARALKHASVRFAVPVVAGVQINRESIPSGYTAGLQDLANNNASRSTMEAKVMESRPGLHHLREGGSEQEADLVLGLLNHAADFPSDSHDTDRLDIGALKNRYGRIGMWQQLAFDGGTSRITAPLQPTKMEG